MVVKSKINDFKTQNLVPKCTKIKIFRGSAPNPAGRAYSAPPDPLAGFRGPLRGREGKEGEGWEGGKGGKGRGEGKGRGKGRGREGGEGEGEGSYPPPTIPGSAPDDEQLSSAIDAKLRDVGV